MKVKYLKYRGQRFRVSVSDCDSKTLERRGWYLEKHGTGHRVLRKDYIRGSGRKHQKGKCFWLKDFILSAPKGFEIDHINGNQLDNTRENLRVCSRLQNCWNKRKPSFSHSTSKYKGVRLVRGKYWVARLRTRGYVFSKHFSSEIEAALAYNKVAKEKFGEFARLNKVA